MPISCSNTALTGQSGSIYFVPAATQWCLTASDFPAGTAVAVPSESDYRIGDPVEFVVEGTATLDTAITASTTYYVVSPISSTSVTLSATKGGSALTLNGDADDTGGGHFNMSFSEFEAVCSVKEFSLDLSRESIDVTCLPCGVNTAGSKWAPFKTKQPGFAEGSGSMSIYFTDNQQSLANRLLQNSMLRVQDGAKVELFLDTVSNGATPAAPDLTASLFIAADISIEGMSLSVNTDDATVGELTYSISNPTNVLGADMS